MPARLAKRWLTRSATSASATSWIRTALGRRRIRVATSHVHRGLLLCRKVGWDACSGMGRFHARSVSIRSRAPECLIRRSAAGCRVDTSRRVARGKFERGGTEGCRDHREKEEIDGFHDTYLSVTCSGRITGCRIRRSRRHYRTACRNCDNCEQDIGEKLGHG